MNVFFKSEIGLIAWLILNGLGLTLAISAHGFLKVLGYVDYILTAGIFWFVLYHYMESPFYKNLGAEE